MKRNFKVGKRHGRGLQFNVFTEDELNDIHAATSEVLWKTGVFVEDARQIRFIFTSRIQRRRSWMEVLFGAKIRLKPIGYCANGMAKTDMKTV